MHAQPEKLIAYTRNPAIVRLLERISGQSNILHHDDPSATANTIPHAAIGEDGKVYHVNRYAPNGLYGSVDPAERNYKGLPLKDQCRLLANPNTALALLVELEGQR